MKRECETPGNTEGTMYEKIYEQPMREGAPLPFEMPAGIGGAPFEEYLGIRIEEAKDGRALLSMPFRVKLSQGEGLMHGGALTAIADTALAVAIKSLNVENAYFVTAEMGMKFHAPVRGGMVRAVAEITERDERNIKGVAEVFDEQGVRVASFTSHFKAKRQKPSGY
jgi:uncharacterized protein (TIGR00369 family)